ncbi:hypoxanthine phosphoribosyltransferase [Saccharobesus litoralis]|uniref:Hypoxanthine phosphoribosyltransferase n=1 Tax=Saccharobesus litoralis TaxID=2172099 RepID=A0A2S0VQP4_9ALTE|nr:hypoxanthine phosphoribosyltransferase [Saccharobesus litoralis]AWB66502.1 hypoxanthine phosphoribosyltransferase [Saccharobesus litoralis]
MSEKYFISSDELLYDSFKLGLEIIKSGFKPSFMVAIWRGGTPVGIAVQEILQTSGITTDHISVRTSSYRRIGEREKHVRVHGLDYIIKNINAEDSLLIVDDVFDTGLSIQALLCKLQRKCRRNTPNDIRIATPWFKPSNNQTSLTPDYYLHKSDQWLVFPHELDGLSHQELLDNKPKLKALFDEYQI